jgi:transcriptional regulator with XRE-family HTH domain
MLREARKAAGMSQDDLSKVAGIGKSTISLYESGAREPGADVFLRLLEATGAQVSASRFSDEELRRGRVLSDLLNLAAELPHRWPGDDLDFPARIWKRA